MSELLFLLKMLQLLPRRVVEPPFKKLALAFSAEADGRPSAPMSERLFDGELRTARRDHFPPSFVGIHSPLSLSFLPFLF